MQRMPLLPVGADIGHVSYHTRQNRALHSYTYHNIMLSFECNFDIPKATHQGSLRLKIRGRGRKIGGQMLYALRDLGFGILPQSPAGRAKAEIKSQLLDHVPIAPLEGPIALSLIITWPHLAGHTKKVKVLDRVPHFAKPDADNVAKIILDAMTELGYWYDDAQIAELTVCKSFGQRPGLTVVCDELGLPGGLDFEDVHKGIRARWI